MALGYAIVWIRVHGVGARQWYDVVVDSEKLFDQSGVSPCRSRRVR